MPDLASPSILSTAQAWHSPSDLSIPQRWALGLLVLGAHAGAAWYLTHHISEAPAEPEAAPLMVEMIAPEIRPQPAPPPPALVTPPRPPVPAPRVLSSRAPSSNVMAAPPEPPKPQPVVEAPQAPVATAAVTTSAPTTSEVAAAPPPAAPLPPKQLSASAVRYLVPPQQVYPETSRRLNESGKVSLRVLVDERGRAVEVQITQSSGYSRLDQAAASALRAARFQPYLENGVARSVWAPATITYDLQD
ncbi:MAG TPA: energy transducer TonB [Aquabacterium sp.]|nr:energy transducer TonB [Aquabacterium sp.]